MGRGFPQLSGRPVASSCCEAGEVPGATTTSAHPRPLRLSGNRTSEPPVFLLRWTQRQEPQPTRGLQGVRGKGSGLPCFHGGGCGGNFQKPTFTGRQWRGRRSCGVQREAEPSPQVNGGSSGPVLGASGGGGPPLLQAPLLPCGAACLMQPGPKSRRHQLGCHPRREGALQPNAGCRERREPPWGRRGAWPGSLCSSGPWTRHPRGASSHRGLKLTRPLGPACPHHTDNWSPKAREESPRCLGLPPGKGLEKITAPFPLDAA